MTQRTGFVLHVRPDKIDEYVEAHANVWPEMRDALSSAGIRNYTIFRAGTEVFGYFEAEDLDAAERYLAAQEVCTRWQNADGGSARGARAGRWAAGARADLPSRLALDRVRAVWPRRR